MNIMGVVQSSANLILKLLESWSKPAFKDLLNEINDPKITRYTKRNLAEYLDHLEDIAVFWKDETLTDNHVKEFFGINLKKVRDDDEIRAFIKKWNDKNPEYFYVNLLELLKKIDLWKI